ncbi:serine/threonine protein kinase PrkC [Bacillaceae bacterium]
MLGKRLGGRYKLEECVGEGGMAVVYKARDILLNRTVAVKVLRPQFGHDEEFIRRFRREAQAAASLSHPNVVSIYDIGEDNDIHFIVMEYIEGCTLKELIKKQAPLDVEQAVHIAIEICDALEHAHQNNIIHRDIKPHNILIGKNGRVKVTDFGIARAVTSATITHTGMVMGSVHYFSPEQARGGITGVKSDIYSLGVVLYEMLTGELPFSGDSPISVALKHLQDTFQEPRQLNPRIPQSVENIILKTLAKDPAMRYQSAGEMMEDLQSCLSAQRLNEEKLVLPSYDEEATKVVPAIKERMIRTQAAGETERAEEGEREEPERGEPPERSGFPWMKTFAAIFGLIIFLGIGVLGVNYARGLLYVPDVTTPRVENIPLEEAIRRLEENGLRAEVEKRYDENVASGIVIKQSPPPGMTVKKDSVVKLYVSLGKKPVAMPEFIGLSRSQVESRYKDDYARFHVIQEYSDTVPEGEIMRQIPVPGHKVIPEETEVTIVVSKGKEQVKMPDLVGRSEEEAKSILLQHRLKLGKVTREASDRKKGEVIWQFPYRPGDLVYPGSEISLGISNGKKPKTLSVSEQILVTVGEEEAAEVLILVSDARGNDQVAVNAPVAKTTAYNVSVVVSPEKDGTIRVYKNGKLEEMRNVRYDEKRGGN